MREIKFRAWDVERKSWMNELNYASLEASKKLVDNGIVLEAEAVWRKKRDKMGGHNMGEESCS